MHMENQLQSTTGKLRLYKKIKNIIILLWELLRIVTLLFIKSPDATQNQ